MDIKDIEATFEKILNERRAQDAKWGEQNHPDGTGSKFETSAFNAREHCNLAFENKKGTWTDILTEEFYEALAEDDPVRLETELIQSAAVICAWIEAIHRRNKNGQ